MGTCGHNGTLSCHQIDCKSLEHGNILGMATGAVRPTSRELRGLREVNYRSNKIIMGGEMFGGGVLHMKPRSRQFHPSHRPNRLGKNFPTRCDDSRSS